MAEYLFETHCHTKEVSTCAVATAEEFISLYKNTEYNGIVVTNHMNSATFRRRGLENEPWEVKAEHFLSGYKKIKELAGNDLTILLGMEICFYNQPNDYLVYGITEDFIKTCGDIMALKPEEFSVIAKENGFLFLQAHPLRRGMKITDWKILDGYEVFNGNPRHYSCNEIAEQWAKFHKKSIMTSGSDFHQAEDACIGGVYFKNEIKNNGDFVRELKSGNYRLKKTDFKHTKEE